MLKKIIIATILVMFPAYYSHALSLEQRQTMLKNFLDEYEVRAFGIEVVYMTIEDDCVPCRTLEDHAKKAKTITPNVRYINVNLSDNPEYIKLFSIKMVPFMMILVDGRPKAFSRGIPSFDDFMNTILKLRSRLKRKTTSNKDEGR